MKSAYVTDHTQVPHNMAATQILAEPHAAEVRLQRSGGAILAGLRGDARRNGQRVRPPWVARHQALRHLLAAEDLQDTTICPKCASQGCLWTSPNEVPDSDAMKGCHARCTKHSTCPAHACAGTPYWA